MRRKPLVSRLVAGGRVAVLVACVAAAVPARGETPACPDGACGPNCSVRPGQYGYYQTQWRRWPGSEPRPVKSPAADTPAQPPRSLPPGPDEESPRGTGEGPEASAADRRRFETLAEEADAARLADPARRDEFTARLVAAMLTEHDPQARCIILGLAAGFDTPAAEAICSGALEDPDPRVRFTACEVCVERRAADAVIRLARKARDDVDLGVRLRAVRSLGEIGEPAAVPHLVALLDDPDPAIQSRAVAALARATGRNYGTDVERWRKWAANPQPAAGRWSLGGVVRGLF